MSKRNEYKDRKLRKNKFYNNNGINNNNNLLPNEDYTYMNRGISAGISDNSINNVSSSTSIRPTSEERDKEKVKSLKPQPKYGFRPNKQIHKNNNNNNSYIDYSKSKEVIGLSPKEIDEINQAFTLFGNDYGEINLDEFLEAMTNLKLNKKHSVVYKFIDNLSKSRNGLKKTLSNDEFIGSVGKSLGDKKKKEGLRKMFELFKGEEDESIRKKVFKNICKELGVELNEEINNFINNEISNDEIDFDDFYKLMTKDFQFEPIKNDDDD